MDDYHLLRRNAPAAAPAAAARTPSRPYDRLPDPNPNLTFEQVMQKEELSRYEYRWGPYDLTKTQYNDLYGEASKVILRGTSEEKRDLINALAQVKAGGPIPLQEPVKRAPPGTNVNDLLDLKDQKPNAAGQYELGNLRVPAKEFPEFAAAQREMCAKNPEALDLLYHMENHQTPTPLTVERRPTAELASGNVYRSTNNTIYWSPTLAVRDKESHNKTPPGTGLLHEETHWAAGQLGQVLKEIPVEHFDNLEERRVIQGAEARDLDRRDLPHRTSHSGRSMRVRDVNSLDPEIVIKKRGEATVNQHAGFQQSGHLVSHDKDSVTIQTLAHDKNSLMTFRKVDLQLATGVPRNKLNELINDAGEKQDKVTMHVTRDGVYYENRAQIERWRGSDLPLRPEIAASMDRELRAAGIVPRDQTKSIGHSK